MADFFSISPQGFAMLRRIKADPMFNPSEGEERKLVLYLHRAGLITDFIPSHGRRLTPEGEEALRLEDERLAVAKEEAEKLAQKMADDAAAAERKEASDDAKAASNQRKQFRHDFKIALLSIAGTLLVERLDVILDFFSANIEKVFVLLGLIQ